MQDKLFKIIASTDLDQKISASLTLANSEPEIILPCDELTLETLRSPGRPEGFKVVLPRNVPTRRNLKDEKQRAHFLHAIANIELLAIELPLLCLLRFGSSNLGFIKTQLKIVAEEALHFQMLRNRLRNWGCEFGTVPVHHGLWDYAWKCKNELEHQIIIPCYLEARGLDVTPQFVKNFRELGDDKTADILQRIIDDEIGHVRHGMDYLKSKETELGLNADQIFEDTLKQFFQEKYKSKIKLDEILRRKAGFSEKQLQILNRLRV